MSKYLSLTIAIELVCFFIAVHCLYNDKQKHWRSMILFMLLTCVCEIGGRVAGKNNFGNDWIYNIYLFFEAGFTGVMFTTFISSYIYVKKWAKRLGILFLVTYFFELSRHGPFTFNNVTTTMMSMAFIGVSIIYYYLLIIDENDIMLFKHAPFWWVAGALIFYYCTMVSDLYFSIVKTNIPILSNYRHYTYLVLNIILYGLWSYSFLCRYQQRKLAS